MSVPDLNTGALTPVRQEADCRTFTITGKIPEALNGTLMRNGPNPFSGHFDGEDVLGWWPEAAMLHGITFREGEATAYRNRWVRTKNWAKHFESGTTDRYIDSNPNVNVISHAGMVLALAEGGQPAAINTKLETLGLSSAHSSLSKGFTAHPKIDPVTQELLGFRADWAQPWLRYYAIDADGVETLDMDIPLPAPVMMHDMAITATHSILMDLNVGYDFSMFERGYSIPICWQDKRQSRLGVVPRHGGDIVWFDIEPCFIQHVVNAYNNPDGSIVFDVARYPFYFKQDPKTQGFQPNPLAVLWRYTIDLANHRVREQQLHDLNFELPRINETLTGRKHRFFYAVEQPTAEEMRGIVRYDLQHHSTQHHVVDPGDANSEPIYVPGTNATDEDDGWVLVCVYKHATDTSEIRILDARHINEDPLAIIALPQRIPAGFHGAWIPTSQL